MNAEKRKFDLKEHDNIMINDRRTYVIIFGTNTYHLYIYIMSNIVTPTVSHNVYYIINIIEFVNVPIRQSVIRSTYIRCI